MNLSDLVKTTVKRYFATQLEKNIIQLQIEKNIEYQGDKELLPSIIINVIENAIKYSFDQINIEVILKTINSKPLLEIKDQGCGISDNEKEQAFQKFLEVVAKIPAKPKAQALVYLL